MQYILIQELLRLLSEKYKTDPESFVKLFSNSDYLIGYRYHCNDHAFTHLSKSFRNVLGYDQNNYCSILHLLEKIVHPLDKNEFLRFFSNQFDQLHQSGKLENSASINSIKFRAKHIKGYWKYLIIFSLEYMNILKMQSEKMGIIVSEKIQMDSQFDVDQFTKTINDSIRSEEKKDPGGESTVKLSHREYEILDYISKGLVTKQIADQLNISINTVITHRKNLISKFNVNNTAELIKVTTRLMII